MAGNVFAEVLNARLRGYKRRQGFTKEQTVAWLSLETTYATVTIYRHLRAESLPRDVQGAERYASAFGDKSGRLVCAYERALVDRDADEVQAHYLKLSGLGVLIVSAVLAGLFDRVTDALGASGVGL